jgi:hypothetical protein
MNTYIRRAQAQKIRELKSQGSDVLANAVARFRRSTTEDAKRYNLRRIFRYRVLLREFPEGTPPIPPPQTIPY